MALPLGTIPEVQRSGTTISCINNLVTLADNETQASEAQCTEACMTNYTPGQNEHSETRSASGSESC